MLEINLQKIKFWTVIVIIQIASLGIGYYCANYFDSPASAVSQIQPKSSTKTESKPAAQAVAKAQTTANDECPVKGNISSKSKIYHTKGGSFYDRTDPEMCFQNETEAQAAGFVKSSR